MSFVASFSFHFPDPGKKGDGYFSVLFNEGVLDALDKSFTCFHLSAQLGLDRKAPIVPAVFEGKPASNSNEPLRSRYRLLLCRRIMTGVAPGLAGGGER